MMRYLAFVLFLFTCSQQASAQEIKYSPYEDFDVHNSDYSIAGRVGELLYVYHTNAKGAYLEAYNDIMEKQATIVLDFSPEKYTMPSLLPTPIRS